MRRAQSVLQMTVVPVLLGVLLLLPCQAKARGGGARSAVVLVPHGVGSIQAFPRFGRRGYAHRRPRVRSRDGRRLSSIYLRRGYAGRRFQPGVPIGAYVTGAWPYAWTGFADMPAVRVPTIIKPEVIVIRPDPAGGVAVKTVTRYSYVAGCHAIANGYHCDTSGKSH